MRTCSYSTSRSTYTTSAAEVMHNRLNVDLFFFPLFSLVLLRQIPVCLDKILSAVILVRVAIYSYQHLAHALASVL